MEKKLDTASPVLSEDFNLGIATDSFDAQLIKVIAEGRENGCINHFKNHVAGTEITYFRDSCSTQRSYFSSSCPLQEQGCRLLYTGQARCCAICHNDQLTPMLDLRNKLARLVAWYYVLDHTDAETKSTIVRMASLSEVLCARCYTHQVDGQTPFAPEQKKLWNNPVQSESIP